MRRIHPEMRRRARDLRKNQTPAESTLWFRLRDGRLNGLKFRRQQIIGPFIADFCCPSHNLIIELDGSGHLDQQDYDADRTAWLNSQGYCVVRITNNEVRFQLEAVLEKILQTCPKVADD